MSRIKLLSETVASQVAAGEVVERPASVVKELVENSIDAGARSIEVGIQRGGMSRIRVVDDGCGMDRDDALLSLERHVARRCVLSQSSHSANGGNVFAPGRLDWFRADCIGGLSGDLALNVNHRCWSIGRVEPERSARIFVFSFHARVGSKLWPRFAAGKHFA